MGKDIHLRTGMHFSICHTRAKFIGVRFDRVLHLADITAPRMGSSSREDEVTFYT